MSIFDNSNSLYSTQNKSSFIQSLMLDLKKSVRGEPHSLDEIRQSMTEALRKQTPLISLLKEHHTYIKESLVVCLDRNTQDSEKQFHLKRVLELFAMHGKAEEQTLYKLMDLNSEKEINLTCGNFF